MGILNKQYVDGIYPCFDQHAKKQLYCFSCFRDYPVCPPQGGKVADRTIHSGEKNGIAEYYFQSDDSVESVDPYLFTVSGGLFLAFSNA